MTEDEATPSGRITVSLDTATQAAMDTLTAAMGWSKTDVVNTSVRLLNLVMRETDGMTSQGPRLALIKPDGTVERIHIL